jgi:hypothetical protein
VRDKLSRWSSNIETFFKEDCIEQSRDRVHLIVNLLNYLFTLDQRTTIITGILSKVDADTIFDVQVVQREYANRTEKDDTSSSSQQYSNQPKRKKKSA